MNVEIDIPWLKIGFLWTSIGIVVLQQCCNANYKHVSFFSSEPGAVFGRELRFTFPILNVLFSSAFWKANVLHFDGSQATIRYFAFVFRSIFSSRNTIDGLYVVVHVRHSPCQKCEILQIPYPVKITPSC